jgi:hypothetical protein
MAKRIKRKGGGESGKEATAPLYAKVKCPRCNAVNDDVHANLMLLKSLAGSPTCSKNN